MSIAANVFAPVPARVSQAARLTQVMFNWVMPTVFTTWSSAPGWVHGHQPTWRTSAFALPVGKDNEGAGPRPRHIVSRRLHQTPRPGVTGDDAQIRTTEVAMTPLGVTGMRAKSTFPKI
jgi:hypothetical protein